MPIQTLIQEDIVLSTRINNMVESQTIAMAKKARQLQAQGIDVINLSFGEPDFQTPQYIKDAAKKAIDDGFTFYTPVPGTLELRQAITKKFKEENNITYTADQIVVSTGAKQSLANAVLSIVEPGDDVIILGPYWVSYLEIVKLAEGNPVVINGTISNGFKATALDIEKAITPKTKAIMYSSPCNPTGAIFTKQELQAIAEIVLKQPHLYVIADEIYEHINFVGKHHSMAAIDGMLGRTITINGFSKGYAMTGWRVGYMGAPLPIAQACDKMQGQFTSATCSIAQKAAFAALEGDQTPTRQMAKAYSRRRTLVLDICKDIPGLVVTPPDGAFYVFPNVEAFFGLHAEDTSVISNSTDMCMYLLNHANVSVVPGIAFGDDNCIRVSTAAADDKLVEAFGRIKKSLAQLK